MKDIKKSVDYIFHGLEALDILLCSKEAENLNVRNIVGLLHPLIEDAKRRAHTEVSAISQNKE
ncbi:hypothetical protein [Maridesulfovibrio ferrireducens]|uniref:Uncharacterized protein n=1 Tax=Maridesulfovibrio ferrireducens TaxID=246191 RepID=A0A1G9I1G5_9BACT|nr:hypothetical protein [Maridesulfovibrio ferrireducens]MBI9111377.1 hypothetical protein [Maridesulfovibrio ferrireducens]SDL19087.1 hypothetical protein SAMN05660337_2409 [Maridesulfovibrio ferrireducens]